ncbi:MAG: prepilin peptidase [Anaerolineae bacterium]|nr:prepilin peptidase [Anaerolineae bacterium]
MMASLLGPVLLALLGDALAAVVNWAADVLPPGDLTPDPSPERRGEADPAPPSFSAKGAGILGSPGALRADRRLLVVAVGLVGGALAGHYLGPTWTAVWLVGWGALLLLVAVIDFEHRLVLNRVLLAAGAVALAASALGVPQAAPLRQAVLGGALGFVGFLAIAALGRGAMGAGDVKLAGFIGLLVGYPAVLNALFAGIVFGGLAALAAILMGRGRKSTIPYAPWLALGAMVALVQMAG